MLKNPNNLPNLRLLNITGQALETLPMNCHKCKVIYYSHNRLTSLNNLPFNLHYLNCSDNLITEIDYLSSKLKIFICINDNRPTYILNKVPSIWPSTLTMLNIRNSKIDSLPTIPLNCTVITSHIK